VSIGVELVPEHDEARCTCQVGPNSYGRNFPLSQWSDVARVVESALREGPSEARRDTLSYQLEYQGSMARYQWDEIPTGQRDAAVNAVLAVLSSKGRRGIEASFAADAGAPDIKDLKHRLDATVSPY